MGKRKQFVITGISAGLGLALSQELLAKGHRVIGCGRRENPLHGQYEAAVYQYQKLDITDFSSLKGWAEDIARNEPPIDYLINNAAVIHKNAPLWEIDRDAFNAVIDINIKGTFNVMQAFVPHMLKSGAGIILNLSSGAGRSGFSSISAYCASKWAVEGLTKSLATELPEGMAAIPLSPGVVDTDMLRSTFGESAQNHQKPEQWAKVAVDYILQIKASQSGESLTVPDSTAG